jgi:IclR family pca regulon transcriptional regulator
VAAKPDPMAYLDMVRKEMVETARLISADLSAKH